MTPVNGDRAYMLSSPIAGFVLSNRYDRSPVGQVLMPNRL